MSTKIFFEFFLNLSKNVPKLRSVLIFEYLSDHIKRCLYVLFSDKSGNICLKFVYIIQYTQILVTMEETPEQIISRALDTYAIFSAMEGSRQHGDRLMSPRHQPEVQALRVLRRNHNPFEVAEMLSNESLWI